MTSKTWVDFRAVKEKVTMEMLLKRYGISGFKRIGNDAKGNCPFHESEGGNSLSVNFEKNTFYCFEASHAEKRAGGPWDIGHRAVPQSRSKQEQYP